MTEVTQPRMARGTKPFAGFLATALFALLAFAPFASAAPDPVGSGTTVITLNKGTVNGWKKRGVKLSKVSPAKLSGTKATFTVKSGSLDPTTGLGSVTLNGGLKFKAGSKSATVKAIVIDTSKKSLSANVGGKKMKMATISGFSFARNGFGVNLTIKKFKLTSAAAKQLNKKLGYTAKKGKAKGKGKGNKRAAASKVSSPPFKANQVLGGGSAETQPSTVTVLPSGNVSFAAAAPTITKLQEVGVKITPIGPASEPKKNEFAFPIKGGSLSPTASAGKVETSGGLTLFQKLGTAETTITLGGFTVDYSAKTVSVEVSAVSNASKDLNLGAIGRSSIADITAVGAVASDATARTITVSGTTASLQEVAALVLNGFSQVAEGGTVLQLIPLIEGQLIGEGKNAQEAKEQAPPIAKAQAAALFANKHIKPGDPLGTFSFAAQTQ
jgi:hypothetical protein